MDIQPSREVPQKGTFLAENESRRTLGEASRVAKGIERASSWRDPDAMLAIPHPACCDGKPKLKCVSGGAQRNGKDEGNVEIAAYFDTINQVGRCVC